MQVVTAAMMTTTQWTEMSVMNAGNNQQMDYGNSIFRCLLILTRLFVMLSCLVHSDSCIYEGHIATDNIGVASTSSTMHSDLNGNHTAHTDDDANACTCPVHGRRHDRTPSEEIDILNDNGILRMDMSKIIDRTGLPTYDAALKLESYGYVW